MVRNACLAAANGELHPMQAAFRECHGLQCGFCTPGMLLAALDLLRREVFVDLYRIVKQSLRASTDPPCIFTSRWTSGMRDWPPTRMISSTSFGPSPDCS